jgi:hypothetical protein
MNRSSGAINIEINDIYLESLALCIQYQVILFPRFVPGLQLLRRLEQRPIPKSFYRLISDFQFPVVWE